MASTWTEEQKQKYFAGYAEAYKSELLTTDDTTKFWNFVAEKVGDGKTGKDCKGLFDQLNKEFLGDAYPSPFKSEEMTATWTEEENTKFQLAFDKVDKSQSCGKYSDEFWDEIAKEVGGGKTGKHCFELYLKKIKEAK